MRIEEKEANSTYIGLQDLFYIQANWIDPMLNLGMDY